jgi:hypothetical protein
VSTVGVHHGDLTSQVVVKLLAPGQQRSTFAFRRRELQSIIWPSLVDAHRGALDDDCNYLFTIRKLLHYHFARWCQPSVIFWSWIGDDLILPFLLYWLVLAE